MLPKALSTRAFQLIVVCVILLGSYLTVMLQSLLRLNIQQTVLSWLLIVAMQLMVVLLSAKGAKDATNERTLSSAQQDIVLSGSSDVIRLPIPDQRRALCYMHPHPVTGKVEEKVVYLSRKHEIFFYGPAALVSICGIILTLISIRFMSDKTVQVAGMETPKKRDDVYDVVSGLPYGAPMLVLLVTLGVIVTLWVRWDSVIFMMSTLHVYVIISYPVWLFAFFNDNAPNISIRSIDYRNPHRGVLGRIFGYGSMSQDTAAGDEMQIIKQMNGVPDIMRFSALILSLQNNEVKNLG